MPRDSDRERAILKGGPRSRRVYWADELEAAPSPGPRDGYERTDQFVAVGAVYTYLPGAVARELDRLARVYLWQH